MNAPSRFWFYDSRGDVEGFFDSLDAALVVATHEAKHENREVIVRGDIMGTLITKRVAKVDADGAVTRYEYDPKTGAAREVRA